ncbi:MinD/ParA family protein [Rossellomorea marisflavi]|uniref:MinD/ParA family protein n=1 Tax=Rossellomorea marisflavi TaxID=189381 RepID=UPI001EE30396|nr:MinD/ParA family protein [Rossellomorea marisflavi]UKS67150.1 MinD/ParA family protein [Rossellomorea marisflavi]
MSDQAHKLRQRMNESARTFAVVSGKGGVGKSNITTNLAILMAKRGNRVLLFDMDIGMGNVHLLLGSHRKYSVMDYIEDGHKTIHDVVCKDVHGISYISGGNGLKDLVEWHGERMERFFEGLKELMRHYDYILFDMGAGATSATIEFLLSVDEIIAVTTPEPTAMTDVYSMMKYIFLKDRSKEISIICNRAATKREGRETLLRLKHTVGKFLLKEVSDLGFLPEDPTVRKAVINQVPLVIGYPSSAVSKSLMDVLDCLIPAGAQVKKSSFIEGFRKFFKGVDAVD